MPPAKNRENQSVWRRDIQRVALSDLKNVTFRPRNNGVKSAPFHVLLGAQMPAVSIRASWLLHQFPRGSKKPLRVTVTEQQWRKALPSASWLYRDRLLNMRTAQNALTGRDSDAYVSRGVFPRLGQAHFLFPACYARAQKESLMRNLVLAALAAVLLLALIAFAADASQVPPAKIGVVDMQTVATQSEPAKAAGRPDGSFGMGKERAALEKQGASLKSRLKPRAKIQKQAKTKGGLYQGQTKT